MDVETLNAELNYYKKIVEELKATINLDLGFLMGTMKYYLLNKSEVPRDIKDLITYDKLLLGIINQEK